MEPLTVFAIVDAAAPDMTVVQAAVAQLAKDSAAEPGCLHYAVHLSIHPPQRLILHEIWSDDAALQRHRNSAHVAVFKAALAGTTVTVWASPVRLQS